MQARNLDAELPPVARVRQRDVPDVELDVEVGDSIQYGRSSDNGSDTSRRRNCGNCATREAKKRSTSLNRTPPPGAVDGS